MTGRRATRSKNGCSTCRIRKVKCDEVRPLCARCRTSGMSCEWVLSAPRPRHKPANSRCPLSSRSSNALVLHKQRILLPRDVFGFSTNQQLANSLHLSDMDREYLAYFPQSSIVRWVGKPWKWVFLRHLYSDFASQSSMVMRMILAVSASELENRRSTDPSLSVTTSIRGNPRAGVAHYGAALREFSGILARCREERKLPSKSMIDEIVTAMFFMVTYENLFCSGQNGIAAHLSGVHAFLNACGVFDDPTLELGSNFSHVAKNILLYIMYIGTNFISLGGERQRQSWLTAKNNTIFVNLLDNLYQDTRDTNSLVFQGEYPPEALLDDIAVFQPLEFIHECVKFRYLLLPRIRGVVVQDGDQDIPQLSRTLAQLGKRYNNLVQISAAENPPGRPRELQTIYYSASEYHALQIMLHRLGCANVDKLRPKCGKTCRVLQELVAKLLSVLRKLRAIDPRTLVRVCWPLAVAAEVVEDPAELSWVQQTVETSRQLTGSSAVFEFLDTE